MKTKTTPFTILGSILDPECVQIHSVQRQQSRDQFAGTSASAGAEGLDE